MFDTNVAFRVIISMVDEKQGSDTLQRHFSRQKIIGQIQSIKN